jgi:hypothetical protein
MPHSLVPPFVAQPFLQGTKMDFRVAPAEAVDVGLEARTIEPAKHLVEFLPEEKANGQKRQSLELHFLAEHAAKDLEVCSLSKPRSGKRLLTSGGTLFARPPT